MGVHGLLAAAEVIVPRPRIEDLGVALPKPVDFGGVLRKPGHVAGFVDGFQLFQHIIGLDGAPFGGEESANVPFVGDVGRLAHQPLGEALYVARQVAGEVDGGVGA